MRGSYNSKMKKANHVKVMEIRGRRDTPFQGNRSRGLYELVASISVFLEKGRSEYVSPIVVAQSVSGSVWMRDWSVHGTQLVPDLILDGVDAANL